MAPEDAQYLDKYNTPSEEEPNHIVVIGVGGGGNNAVNHMYRQNIDHVTFVVANTDQQALRKSPVPTKLLLGPNTTRGRGAGAKPDKAKAAAEESAREIEALFTDDTDMVFVTAGMGGGTGTGAAPIVARIAKERGLLTIGIVTIPFLFEGMVKIDKALAGADELSKYVDAIMVVNNERLVEIYPDIDMESSFAKADDVLSTAASSIAEIVTRSGYINLDFNDVDTTLRDGGTAIIAVGFGEGPGRVTQAINNALESPLLRNTDIYTSKRVLFNLYYSTNGKKLQMHEVSELTSFVQRIEEQVEVIWGITFDDNLGDKVKFTILASGFDVSIDDKGKKVIKGDKPDTLTGNNGDQVDLSRISEVYGTKIDNIVREKETQNFILFSLATLDDEALLEHFEKSPTFSRVRRSASAQPPVATSQQAGGSTFVPLSDISPIDDDDEFIVDLQDD